MTTELDTRPYVGGQAVLEGVMMRSPRSLAIAVRRPDGTIVVREDTWVSLFDKLRFLRWPLLRGGIVMIESLYNGIQALNFSAEQALAEEDRPAEKRSSAQVAGTLAVSLLLAFGIFVGLPHMMAWGSGGLVGRPLGVDSFAFHALDGFFKIAIFVGYIWAISRVPEIRRVFEYHGAEHKAINTYESEQELTVENARKWTTFHPRCGTSFVLFVLTLSIFMFAAVLPFVPKVSDIAAVNHLAMVLIKIPLMLPLAGVAYEINKLASRHPEWWWVQVLVVPGRLMQRLTTKEPSDDQLEIALAAMRAAIRHEARLSAVARDQIPGAATSHVAVFKSFGEVVSCWTNSNTSSAATRT